jgi:hypothetical protein
VGEAARLEGAAETGIGDVDAAYELTGQVYDFFLDRFGRDSIDGAGMPVVSTVHFCEEPLEPTECPYENAFWNGEQMIYGADMLTEDISGHELAHGVVESESNLFYYYQYIWGFDAPISADYAIQMTTGVTVPAGGLMHFMHAFGFDAEEGELYDGGVIEYSVDGGGSWQDAGEMIVAGATYTGPIEADSNPLDGRMAFSGESGGYASSRLDLSSLAGEDVRFRFRIGTDSSVHDHGWFIDDVRIYRCADQTPPPPAPPTPPALAPAPAPASAPAKRGKGSARKACIARATRKHGRQVRAANRRNGKARTRTRRAAHKRKRKAVVRCKSRSSRKQDRRGGRGGGPVQKRYKTFRPLPDGA